jgi:hypothetical protein
MTRQMTQHFPSMKDCPTKGRDYGIIAIDQWGVEHTSVHENICHTLWSWEHIIWWRYDDDTLLEMARNKILELTDE